MEQIPEQWRSYEARFNNMAGWMDRIDASLATMFKNVANSAQEFEVEKQNFEGLWADVDERKEDMKWLVEKLDQLIAHRYNKYSGRR